MIPAIKTTHLCLLCPVWSKGVLNLQCHCGYPIVCRSEALQETRHSVDPSKNCPQKCFFKFALEISSKWSNIENYRFAILERCDQFTVGLQGLQRLLKTEPCVVFPALIQSAREAEQTAHPVIFPLKHQPDISPFGCSCLTIGKDCCAYSLIYYFS